VIIPHYDNAEGGHHDTRYCYLGERRLARLERDLPDGSFVLGVDEHTAVLLDLATQQATVVGKGRLTVRRRGLSVVYPSGAQVSFDHVATATNYDQAVAGPSPSDTDTVVAPHDEPSAATCSAASSLGAAAETAEAAFNAALKERDVDGCVTAILDLEQARRDWATDTLTSNEGELATAALRRMVVRLGELAETGSRDPDEALSPFIATILELRHRARSTNDYATSDWIRDRLQASGLEVRDTPGGVEWLRA
jgi:cysteinyl-tRNA synthetase